MGDLFVMGKRSRISNSNTTNIATTMIYTRLYCRFMERGLKWRLPLLNITASNSDINSCPFSSPAIKIPTNLKGIFAGRRMKGLSIERLRLSSNCDHLRNIGATVWSLWGRGYRNRRAHDRTFDGLRGRACGSYVSDPALSIQICNYNPNS